MKLAAVFLALAIGVGMVLTVRNYKVLRYEETRNYGHGPGDNVGTEAAGVKLNLYQNEIAGLRIKYPAGSEVGESLNFKSQDLKILPNWDQVVGVGERASVVRFGGTLDVQIENLAKGTALPDIVDREVSTLSKAGTKLSREREYINTDWVGVTILSWNVNNKLKQRGLAVKGKKLVIVDSTGDEGVFKEVVGSLIIF